MERPNNTTLALLGGVGLLILLLVIFAVTRDEDQDKLGDASTFSSVDTDLNQACSGQAVYEQIKRALFHEAVALRGKDAQAYEQIAGAASVRMENPAAESEARKDGGIDCAGSLAIDLPPGVATVAGIHQLMTDIYYTVQPAAGGQRKVVQLRGAERIVGDLAGLTIQAPPTMPAPAPGPVQTVPDDPLAAQPDDGAPPPTTPSAQPSYDCGRARSQSERAVCGDPGLASLDRSMAAEYARAMAAATPQQQAILRQTRDRFLSYRDDCPNSACIGSAYNDRVREIRDIMAGRWSPNR